MTGRPGVAVAQRRVVYVVVAILIWLGTSVASATEPPAVASPDAAVLVAEGLTKYHGQEYAEALVLFDQAVKADPGMMAARHYRGLSRAHLGQTREAIIDFEVVLLREPSWAETDLELGIVLVGAGRYSEALPHLIHAGEKEQLRAAAAFYEAVARWRLGDVEAAKALFRRAAEDNELRLAAEYQLGTMAYERQDWTSATAHFTAVTDAAGNSDIGRKAADFLRLIRWQSSVPYSLFASAGLSYDSNVSLAPNDDSEKDALGITGESDGRADFYAGGAYTPWHSSAGQISLGYDFSQRLYFDHTGFDLQGHRPSLQISFNCQPLRFGVLGTYAYYRLDNDSFLQEGTVLPWLRYFESGWGWADVSYRFRRADYLEERYARLDDSSHVVNLRQFVRLGENGPIPWLGYGFESRHAVHTDGKVFAFDAHQAEAGVSWPRLPIVGAGFEIAYRYSYENYNDASGGRDDNEHGVAATIAKSFLSNFLLRLSYVGTFDDSNINTFTYNRSVVSVNLEVRL